MCHDLDARKAPKLIGFYAMRNLDLSHSHHLLPEIILVPPDRAVPASNRLVLAHHDVFCNLVK